MRPIWSGSISFGLVNIPVRLYSATQEQVLSFDLLHREDMSPVGYAKICKHDGKQLQNQDIVRGYEYRKGEYVVVEDEDFERANPKRTKAIEILAFVNEDEIDSTYFEKPYFLEPDKGADKPYALLREAMERSGKIGIGKFVFKSREHLGAIMVEGNVLVLNQLRFASEVRDASDLRLPEEGQADQREVDLATALVEQLTQPFQPEAYKDEYTEDLKRVIEEKAEGKVPAEIGKEPEPTPVVDLMSVLKASLEQAKQKAA